MQMTLIPWQVEKPAAKVPDCLGRVQQVLSRHGTKATDEFRLNDFKLAFEIFTAVGGFYRARECGCPAAGSEEC